MAIVVGAMGVRYAFRRPFRSYSSTATRFPRSLVAAIPRRVSENIKCDRSRVVREGTSAPSERQNSMPSLKVTIARFVDDHQPGFVECTFSDASGITHSIIEKVPVISAEQLWIDSKYPRPGEIECTVLQKFTDARGDLAKIDTEIPDHIESTRGETEFVVFWSEIVGGSST